MNDELITFNNIKKRFGKNLILDSINFQIPEKKITGIIGASGEGKTTILKLLVGFYKPNKGEIKYLKRNINKDMKNVRKIFGFSTEDGSFHERLTVFENVKHFGKLHQVPSKNINEKIREILKFVGLDKAENTLAGRISMGMKKRLDVAISLMHDPEVLIMDEPTADLDPLLRNHMLSLIKKIRDKGTTVILTTQMLSEMDKVCDKIVILYNKNIVEQGTPKEIKKKYKQPDLDGVFTKIFSQRERQENLRLKKEGSEKKTDLKGESSEKNKSEIKKRDKGVVSKKKEDKKEKIEKSAGEDDGKSSEDEKDNLVKSEDKSEEDKTLDDIKKEVSEKMDSDESNKEGERSEDKSEGDSEEIVDKKEDEE